MLNHNSIYIESVSKILHKYDPMGLASMGCPKNEYSPEASLILKQCLRIKTPSELQNLIYEIFKQMFQPISVGKLIEYRELSMEIFGKLKIYGVI